MNKRVELYTIIEASSTDSLIDLVQDSIQNNGWQPLGNISGIATCDDRGVIIKSKFYQAMVKYELSA